MDASPKGILIPLLAGGEDTLVEFKSFPPRDDVTKRKIAMAAVALANAASLGGYPKGFLILGVSDSNMVVGVESNTQHRTEFRELISAKSNPPVTVLNIHEIKTADLPSSIKCDACNEVVYVLEIGPAGGGPVRYYESKTSKGVLLIRDGPRNRDMTNEELHRLSSGPPKTPRLSLRLLDEREHEVESLVLRPKFLVKKVEDLKPSTPAPQERALTPQEKEFYEKILRQTAPQMAVIEQAKRTMELLKLGDSMASSLLPTGINRIPAPNTLPLRFALSNSGTAPAEDVRVTIRFPEGFLLGEKSEYQRPGTISRIMPISPNYIGVFKADDSPECVTANLRAVKLSNDVTWTEFDPIYVTAPNAEGEYCVEVKITADFQKPVHQTLALFVKPIIEEIS